MQCIRLALRVECSCYFVASGGMHCLFFEEKMMHSSSQWQCTVVEKMMHDSALGWQWHGMAQMYCSAHGWTDSLSVRSHTSLVTHFSQRQIGRLIHNINHPNQF